MSLITALQSGEIHLWLASYDDVGAERLHGAYRELLTAGERERERRFHFSTDRRRYLVTRALVRTVLSRYAPVDPADWLFSTNRYGRPEIANVAANYVGLAFNVSHTRALIALGVTVQRALGVDVENVREREITFEIADRFFAPVEVAALAAVPKNRQQERFFEYWTLKESYIKARGMGLSLPLDKFCFHYPDECSVSLSLAPELADDPARWQFWQFRLMKDYLVALCVERRNAVPADVVVRKTTPLVADETVVLECHCLRKSKSIPRRGIG